MSNTLYCTEIAAKISAQLHQNPDHYMRIHEVLGTSNSHNGETLFTVCADAARIFDQIEDAIGDYFIDWHKASDRYAKKILDFLLSGRKPSAIDMVSMASQSIEASK